MAMFPCNMGSSGGTAPHEIFTFYGYASGHSIDNERTLQTAGWTVIGDYVNMLHNQGSVPTFTCKQPCTVCEYNTTGLVAEYRLNTVGQTVQGSVDSGSWAIF